MLQANVIAVDLGASSGRLVRVSIENGELELEEVHRFPNEGIYINGRIYTDILSIFHEILAGLQKVCLSGRKIDAIGIDSWGVDFAFLDTDGELLGNPYHYRDTQGTGMIEAAEKIFGKRGLFYETGIQDMWNNTVYQIMGIQKRKPAYLDRVGHMLMIPDILGYFLTGSKTVEYTSASTTQMYDVREKKWADKVCRELGIRSEMLPEVVMTGTEKGVLTADVKKLIGLAEEESLRLIATAEHDSAAAAYAVPTDETHYIFISSGTWSIIGWVTDDPIVTDEIFEKEYSNEGAAFGKVKLVKTIMGMWLIQELRKCWKRQGKQIDYGFLVEAEENAAPFSHFIDVDDALFASPMDMEAAINQYCAQTGQSIMEEQGDFYRTVMESLAFKYRESIDDLEKITGKTVDKVYLLGGAIQDHAFCQYIANATGKQVSAGPIEATAIGNAMIQMEALGVFSDEKAHTEAIKKFADISCYEPQETELWDRMYETYKRVTTKEK